MAKRQHIHRAVQEAVLGWGAARDVDAAARHLAQSRSRLEAPLVRQLVSEIAEVSVECVIALLADAANSDPGAALTRVGDADLTPTQLGRLSAWVTDLAATAKALGLSVEAWSHEVGAAANRVLAASALEAGHVGGTGASLFAGARRHWSAMVSRRK